MYGVDFVEAVVINVVKCSSTTQNYAEPPPRIFEVDWPLEPLRTGELSGVDINAKGNPVIFHRGEHVWERE